MGSSAAALRGDFCNKHWRRDPTVHLSNISGSTPKPHVESPQIRFPEQRGIVRKLYIYIYIYNLRAHAYTCTYDYIYICICMYIYIYGWLDKNNLFIWSWLSSYKLLGVIALTIPIIPVMSQLEGITILYKHVYTLHRLLKDFIICFFTCGLTSQKKHFLCAPKWLFPYRCPYFSLAIWSYTHFLLVLSKEFAGMIRNNNYFHIYIFIYFHIFSYIFIYFHIFSYIFIIIPATPSNPSIPIPIPSRASLLIVLGQNPTGTSNNLDLQMGPRSQKKWPGDPARKTHRKTHRKTIGKP